MATSGTITKRINLKYGQYIDVDFVWRRAAYDMPDNTSGIHFKVYMTTSAGIMVESDTSYTYNHQEATYRFNGDTYYFRGVHPPEDGIADAGVRPLPTFDWECSVENELTKIIQPNTTFELHSWNMGFYHKNNTNPLLIDFKIDGGIVNRVYYITQGETKLPNMEYSITGTLEINPVPVSAKILTTSNFSDEDNPSITYSKPYGAISSFNACLSFNGTTADITPYKSLDVNSTSYTFELTNAEREYIRTNIQGSNSRKVWFILKTTFDGETGVFESKTERTLTIINANPILTPTVVDTNTATIALTGDANKLVKFYSDAKATLNAEVLKNSTLSYFEIKNGSKYGNTQTYTFEDVENHVFNFLIRDSRGNTATTALTPNMVEYVKLTCNLGNNLPDTDGNYDINVSGNYFNGTFGAVANTLTVEYRIKEEDGSYGDWTVMPITFNNNTYEATTSLSGLDYRKYYVVQLRAADKLATVETAETQIHATPVFSWSEEDFEFNCDVRVGGDLRLKKEGSNYGCTLYFGDGSYASMSEETDDDLTIHATDLTLEATNLNLNGDNIKINGSSFPAVSSGTWMPVLTKSAPVSSYETQQGWWQRVGNCVTIGWNIKVNCNSGYQTTTIGIGNAPFMPQYTAGGGGIAYNMYVSAGFCFEGWVINNDGGITPRLQPCNGTAAGNLNISSSGYYPTGGGSMTLMGTLCYTTND